MLAAPANAAAISLFGGAAIIAGVAFGIAAVLVADAFARRRRARRRREQRPGFIPTPQGYRRIDE